MFLAWATHFPLLSVGCLSRVSISCLPMSAHEYLTSHRIGNAFCVPPKGSVCVTFDRSNKKFEHLHGSNPQITLHHRFNITDITNYFCRMTSRYWDHQTPIRTIPRHTKMERFRRDQRKLCPSCVAPRNDEVSGTGKTEATGMSQGR